eukprot:jgi/Undpi1/9381/HiC_scaffold_26.g11839.m1
MEVRSRQDAKSVCIKRRHGAMSAGDVLEEDCFVCYVKAVALIGLRGCGRGEKRRRGGRSLVASALSKIGVGSIEVGELLCDSLDEVLDSTLLRFAISSTQTVTAERAYYKVMEGDPLTDNEERKVWIGDIIDPAPPVGSTASTIGISWTEPCAVEGFFLKMITRQGDGLTDVVTSVPCETGTTQEICLVETTLVYSKEPIKNVMDKPDENREAQKGKDRRSLTVNALNITYARTLLRRTSSPGLPYEQQTDGEDALSSITLNAAVSTIRKEVEADLVHLIGLLPDYCGISTIFGDGDSGAYALTSADCVDGLTVGRELGHNMGCDRDRDTLEDEDEGHAYAYGLRYCTGTNPYVTIMSHEENCNGGFINYYSNPDVTYFDKPTGTETENCARRIKETMDTVANYMEAGGDGCVSTGDPCTITSDCCDMTCVEGVCGVK